MSANTNDFPPKLEPSRSTGKAQKVASAVEFVKVNVCRACLTKNLFRTSTMTNTLPLLRSLRRYSWLSLWKDFFAGITVACIHIPQSMGTGMAANLGPIYGLYMTFFPGLLYALLGTSLHNSLGAFAPSAALVGVAVARFRAIFAAKYLPNQTVEIVKNAAFPDVALQHVEIAVCITLMAGIFQLFFALFRLEFLTRIFSHAVLDPFNCACSLQIILVQVPNMLGVSLDQYYGLNKHISMIILLLTNITTIRWLDTLLSITAASIIIGFRDFIQPKLFQKFKIVIPMEFFLVIIFTGIAYGMNLNELYGLRILGKQPSPVGIPAPSVPRLGTYMPHVLFQGFLSGLVAMAFNTQATKPASRKHGYRVSSRRELIAVGASNVFSSFFSCFVASANIGRISILDSLGARSQIASLFGCLLTGLLLAFASQALFYLPSGVIGTIITLTLSMSLKLFEDLPNIWKSCKLDAIQWMLTFISCILLDLEWGLVIGLCFSLMRMQYQSDEPYLTVKHFADPQSSPTSTQSPFGWFRLPSNPALRVLQMGASLSYANTDKFVRRMLLAADSPGVTEDIGRRASKIACDMKPNETNHQNNGLTRMRKTFEPSLDGAAKVSPVSTVLAVQPPHEDVQVRYLIVDCAALMFIDSAGIRALVYLMAEMKKRDVSLWLAGCSESVRSLLASNIKTLPVENIVPTIPSALEKIAATGDLSIFSQQESAASPPTSSVADDQTITNQFWHVDGMPESERSNIALQHLDPDEVLSCGVDSLDEENQEDVEAVIATVHHGNEYEPSCKPSFESSCSQGTYNSSQSPSQLWMVNNSNEYNRDSSMERNGFGVSKIGTLEEVKEEMSKF